MPTLHLIKRKGEKDDIANALETAAQQKDIQTNIIEAQSYDFSQEPQLQNGDALYRISLDTRSRLIEKRLILDGIQTLYQDADFCLKDIHGSAVGMIYTLIEEKAGVPIIPTIYDLPETQELQQRAVEKLGGFPVVIKATGGTHGHGVMKIDSLESLNSVADYLRDQSPFFMLRQFIPHQRQGRLIVLDGEVIASHENLRSIDFRTNTGSNSVRKRQVVVHDEMIQQIAIQAVESLHLRYGGVDILFHEKNNTPYVAEVNYPCYFLTTQEMTGIDVAGKLVDALMQGGK